MSAIEGSVLVDGATGYLGSHLVERLRRAGCAVTALVHPGAKEGDIAVLRSIGATVAVADLSKSDPQSIQAQIGQCQTVVHLIGSVAPKKGERLDDLHIGQTKNLIEACKLSSVKKIVMVTTLGARAGSGIQYLETKSLAEKVITSSGIDYTILRPPLLLGRTFGNRDSKLISRYREMVLQKKFVPLINGGKNKLQPLFIADMVEAIYKCINTEADCRNTIFDIAGPEVISMRQLVEMLMQSCGVQKPFVALPPALADIIASICESIQPVPIISSDQVKLATADNICTDNALSGRLKVELTPVKRALESYNTESAGLSAVH